MIICQRAGFKWWARRIQTLNTKVTHKIEQLVFARSFFLHRNCALWTIPFSFWWFSYSNTAIMEPLDLTLRTIQCNCKINQYSCTMLTYFRIITSNHFSIWNLNVWLYQIAVFLWHTKCIPDCRGSNEVHLDQHLTIQLYLVLVPLLQEYSEYLIWKIICIQEIH